MAESNASIDPVQLSYIRPRIITCHAFETVEKQIFRELSTTTISKERS
jgi:hypothetical protein